MSLQDKLSAIDWHNTLDAYGPAHEIPGLIRALATDNSEYQREAINQLWDRVWQYGRITPASSVVIPLLIDCIDANLTPRVLRSLLHLLFCLGDGSNPWAREITNLKTYGEKDEYEGLALLEREEKLSREEIDQTFVQAEIYVKQCHAAVRDGLSVYLRLLETHPDWKVRWEVTWLTTIFPEEFESLAPCLRSHIRDETDPQVKSMLIWSLGRIHRGAGTDQDLDFFYDLATSRSHPRVYFHAACAYASIAGERTSSYIAALITTGIYLCQLNTLHGCCALACIGAERAIPFFGVLLNKIQGLDGQYFFHQFEPVIDTLLDLVFGKKRDVLAAGLPRKMVEGKQVKINGRHYRLGLEYLPPLRTILTSTEYQALTILVSAPNLWGFEDNVYALYGLPTTREELQALLEANKPHTG